MGLAFRKARLKDSELELNSHPASSVSHTRTTLVVGGWVAGPDTIDVTGFVVFATGILLAIFFNKKVPGRFGRPVTTCEQVCSRLQLLKRFYKGIVVIFCVKQAEIDLTFNSI